MVEMRTSMPSGTLPLKPTTKRWNLRPMLEATALSPTVTQ
jgi:hypothetical protein